MSSKLILDGAGGELAKPLLIRKIKKLGESKHGMNKRRIERPRSVCLSLNLVSGPFSPSIASTTKTLNPLRPTNPLGFCAAKPSASSSQHAADGVLLG